MQTYNLPEWTGNVGRGQGKAREKMSIVFQLLAEKNENLFSISKIKCSKRGGFVVSKELWKTEKRNKFILAKWCHFSDNKYVKKLQRIDCPAEEFPNIVKHKEGAEPEAGWLLAYKS